MLLNSGRSNRSKRRFSSFFRMRPTGKAGNLDADIQKPHIRRNAFGVCLWSGFYFIKDCFLEVECEFRQNLAEKGRQWHVGIGAHPYVIRDELDPVNMPTFIYLTVATGLLTS